MARLIDADIALENIDGWLDTVGTALIGRGLSYYAELQGCIEDAPTVDAVPVVHGRWITWEEAGNDIPSPHRHECSVCHDAAQVLINGIELLSDYCPNCGAIMDGAK